MIRARRGGGGDGQGGGPPDKVGRAAAGLAGQCDVPCAVGDFVEEQGECRRAVRLCSRT
jgi:hypothetical protein